MKNSSLRIFTSILSVLACFACLPKMKAAPQVAPAPDGCYPGFTTAEGCLALQNLTAGSGNTGVGWRSLFSVGDGSFNTGVGAGTLVLNTGDNNTAVGVAALLLNTTGGDNTAVGTDALALNTSGSANVAVGTFAAQNNDSSGTGTAFFNTAVGGFALRANVDGTENTAVGAGAIESGDGGRGNTAVGFLAGNNITGNFNTCLGDSAGSNLIGGEGNIYIGAQVQPGSADEFEFIRIGNDINFTGPYDTYIAGIYNRAPGVGAIQMVGNTPDGKLFSPPSSRRFKHDIKPMDKASEVILALKPVTFHYNADTTNTPNSGLIAEEVTEVSPDLVICDKEGKPHAVRYDQVNAMLLNEFLKEHKTVQEQGAAIARQRKDFEAATSQHQKEIEALTATVKEQAAQIQKVSAQVEVNKPTPRVVVIKP